MAQGVRIPLPAFMDPENIRESINEQVAEALSARGINEKTLPPEVQKALPETIEEQVVNLLARDYGIVWRMEENEAPVLTKVPERKNWDIRNLTPEQVAELQQDSVDDIEEAVTTGIFLSVSAVVSLAALGFPTEDTSSRSTNNRALLKETH